MGDRPYWKWWTVIGAAIFAGGQAAESTGQVPPGTVQAAVDLFQAFGVLLGVTGAARKLERIAAK